MRNLSLRAVLCLLGSMLVLAAHTSVAAEPANESPGKGLPDNRPRVISWVPPYGVEASLQAIESSPLIGANLTHLGLQLWNPSADGRGLVFAPKSKAGDLVTPDELLRLRDWARARNVKVLLTVYNNSQALGRWDWALAKRAFAEQPQDFANALLVEMKRYGLDGIDLDLEGEGNFDADRPAYAKFVALLSEALKAQGKLLTIDSFHSPCANAPNMSWWPDWRGQIDAIHSMGYDDLYEGSTEVFTPPGRPTCAQGAHIFKYSWQLQYGLRAGYQPHQIVLGLPTWVDHWGKGGLGADARSHVREVQALGAGIALWDLQLAAPAWRADATWQAVRALRVEPGEGWKAMQ